MNLPFDVALGRFHDTTEDTLGLLFLDWKFSGFCIEDEYRPLEKKLPGETRIPAGVYELVIEHSPKFSPKYGHPMITVKGVPGFTGIRWHWGTSEKDTEGCIVTGFSMHFNNTGTSRMERSREAYDVIYPLVAASIKKGTTLFYVDDLNPWSIIKPKFNTPLSLA